MNFFLLFAESVFLLLLLFFFFNDTATTEIYTLSYTTLFRSAPREEGTWRGRSRRGRRRTGDGAGKPDGGRPTRVGPHLGALRANRRGHGASWVPPPATVPGERQRGVVLRGGRAPCRSELQGT